VRDDVRERLHNVNHLQVTVTVWLERDYSRSEDLEVPDGSTREEVTALVSERFGPDGWWYFDIKPLV